MVFNLYFSNELTNSYSLNNNYKIYKYSIKKNNDCNIETSFNIDFKKDVHKKTFGKGNTCTFIMTMEPDKKIIYGLNCSFNLKRAKVDEKGFQRYVQKMLKQELDINWSPGTVLVRREKKKKDKNNKDMQQYV